MSRNKRKKKNTVKVTSTVKKSDAVFVASELADDKLIGQELLGQISKTLVYELEEGGKTIHGLSYIGVREAARIINRDPKSGHKIQISDRPPSISEKTIDGELGIEVMVYAQDIKSGGGSWGIKFEPYRKELFDGKGNQSKNRFAVEIALSKAQRNAMFNLLPHHLIDNIIKKFIEKGYAVEKIEAPKTSTREIVPQATGTRKLYEATLKRVGRIKDNKKSLEEALENVDNMPISGEERGQIRRKIKRALEKL